MTAPSRALAAALAISASLMAAGCASLQGKCARNPWMVCGDRVAVHKNFVYLDDPAFLYKNTAVAARSGGAYRFRLSLFFNPYRARSLSLSAAILPARLDTSAGAPSGPDPRISYPCLLASGLASEEGADSTGGWDSLFAVKVSRKKDRVNLAFACKDYRPRWGREDTLELRFVDAPGDSTSVMALPFSTSFHGPVYSLLIGAFLILSMTITGEFLANGR